MFFDQKFNDKVTRRSFSKQKNVLEMSNLLEIQKNSYEKFINIELENLIKNLFPITSPKGKYTLNFIKITLGDPKSSIDQCRYESTTYDVPLYVDVELVDNETGEVKETTKKKSKSNKPSGIFFGNIPIMCDKGTFIINGIEKFVISQIIRSPGLYCLNKSQIKLNNSRKKNVDNSVCELLPYKGTIMLFNVPENKKQIQILLRSVNGEQAISILATSFLKAYGLSYENITSIFGMNNIHINETLANDPFDRKTILDYNDIKYLIDEIEKEKHDGFEYDDIIHKGSPIDRKLRILIYEYLKVLEDIGYENKNDLDNPKLIKILDKIVTERAAKDIAEKLGINTKTLDASVNEEDFSYQALFVTHLFTLRFYDLYSAGRYKVNRKLRVSERLYKRVIADNILDKQNNVIIPENTLLTKSQIDIIKNYSKDNNISFQYKYDIDNIFNAFKVPQKHITNKINLEKVSIRDSVDENLIIDIFGRQECNNLTLTIEDIISAISYSFNIIYDCGSYDDIDHLGNKRLKLFHEQLRNKLNSAIIKIEKSIAERLAIADSDNPRVGETIELNADGVSIATPKEVSVKNLINTKPFQMVLKEFFNSYQLIQFIDQQNPLSELTNKRRISAMGPGGISREDPNLDVRDVHNSHYGRICPIETPEGMNIGLIMSLASYAKVDENGFILTPYYVVKDSVITNEVRWLTSLQDDEYIIAESNIETDEKNKIIQSQVVCRYKGQTQLFTPKEIDYIDIIPKQVVSAAASLIPFLENDDANRALMGANMQRQAVPLIKSSAPWVGTGSEYVIAHNSGTAVICDRDGIVTKNDGKHIEVTHDDETKKVYDLVKYRKSNQNTCTNQTSMVDLNQKVKANDFLANGPAMDNGELSLGKNVLVGFSTWNGYNFEDAIILSERLVNEDVFTSIHIDEYKAQCLLTKNGDEEITRDIPNVSDSAKRYLSEDGIIMIGAEVKEGDILVGKVTPRGQVDLPPEEKLLYTIFGEKTKALKDSSLKVPHGGEGIVIDVKRFKNTESNNCDLGDDVIEIVKVYIAQKRKIQVGDKMAGRHGNKGIVSKIVPIADMPFLDDGTPLDVILNPLGVPSRMNIGQILELHLGMCSLELGKKELLSLVYNNADAKAIVSRYGLSEFIAKNLIKHIKELIKKIQPNSFDDLLNQINNNDLLICLSKVGLNFDDIGYKMCTPVFEGVKRDELVDIMHESGIDKIANHGKFKVRDGKTGDYFDGEIAVGIMYMLKLDHMVDDKIHARSVGPYSKITQQPLGGKSQNGGQRFGEMEVWALEAYGAAYNLHELLTIKSDDVRGRSLTYNAIIKGEEIPTGGTPESFKLLTKKLQGLCLSLDVETDKYQCIDINKVISKEYDDEETDQEINEHFISQQQNFDLDDANEDNF